MNGKIALITGATSGIGKAIAKGLAAQGAHLVLLARDKQRGEAALRDVGGKGEVIVCDLASQDSIRSAAAEFRARHEKLDVLVNAAGVFVKDKTLTMDGVEKTFAVNYLAYFLLTNLLVESLKRGSPSRVVNVSSRYGGAKIDFGDVQQLSKPYSYLRSTPPTMLARVMFTQELADRLRGSGVVVNTLHPGLVANTRLLADTGGPFRWITNTFGGTPEKGADTAIWLATSPEAAKFTGQMFSKRKEMKTPGQGEDPAARKRLWDESARLTKLS